MDYDADRSSDELDLVDATIDRLADEVGEVVDSGSGAGFGRRHLDYTFEHEATAGRLVSEVESTFASRSDLDLSVMTVEFDDEGQGGQALINEPRQG